MVTKFNVTKDGKDRKRKKQASPKRRQDVAKTQGAARPHSSRMLTEGHFVSATNNHADIYTVEIVRNKK
jgi:hypothetical protein